MKINKNILSRFVFVFVLSFLVTAVVTYLYTLIIHGAGVVNWELSVVLAIVMGIVRSIHK